MNIETSINAFCFKGLIQTQLKTGLESSHQGVKSAFLDWDQLRQKFLILLEVGIFKFVFKFFNLYLAKRIRRVESRPCFTIVLSLYICYIQYWQLKFWIGIPH